MSYRFVGDVPNCFLCFPMMFFDFAGLGADFPGQTYETPDPGQNLRVSYSKIMAYRNSFISKAHEDLKKIGPFL